MKDIQDMLLSLYDIGKDLYETAYCLSSKLEDTGISTVINEPLSKKHMTERIKSIKYDVNYVTNYIEAAIRSSKS